jgi:C-terminal processing protease CtpA/Prc
MNINRIISIFIIFSLLLIGCKKESDEDPNIAKLENDLEISDFIWKGLNYYYYWQESVINLADSKLDNLSNYSFYLSQNPNPENFFNSLKHPDDRFSWISDDYEELENYLQGIDYSDGMEFGLFLECNDQNVFGFVRYVHKDTDADINGIKRGYFFNAVNGTILNKDNYGDLLFDDNVLTNTFGFADLNYDENNQCASLISNNTNITLNKSRLVKNPIHISKTIDINQKKIGYLMYNQFLGNVESENIDYHIELNSVFGSFKSEGINELVIDLRYNPGGRISTSINLASMITGQFNNQIFAKEKWNSKLMDYWDEKNPDNLINRFVDNMDGVSINSLNLNKVYILTTSRTASASELLINGLDPYIDVIHIGDYTVGKNQGSITVYDWINDQGEKNPNHKYAMQPIVLKIGNVAGYTDFPNGLVPDYEIKESIRTAGELGNKNEQLLKIAIDHIFGNVQFISSDDNIKQIDIPEESLKQQLIKDKIIIK